MRTPKRSAPQCAGVVGESLGTCDHVTHALHVEVVRMLRVGAQKGVGAEQTGDVQFVTELRHQAVVERARVLVARTALQQGQQYAAQQAEGVEYRQHVQHAVATREIEQRLHLREVREQVGV
jgi:hypothetical protein